jgi:hypothetical protein
MYLLLIYSEMGKDNLENGKDDSKKSKDDSEKGKDDSEKSKDDSENGKDDSEKGKDDSENGKDNSEKNKDEALKNLNRVFSAASPSIIESFVQFLATHHESLESVQDWPDFYMLLCLVMKKIGHKTSLSPVLPSILSLWESSRQVIPGKAS